MKSAAVLALLLAGASASVEDQRRLLESVRGNIGEDKVVSIKTHHMTAGLEDLLEFHGADHFGQADSDLHFRLSPDAVRALEEAEFHFEDQTEDWINHFETNFQDPNFICHDEPDVCAGRDLQTFYQSYQSMAALHSRMDSVAAASGGLATIGSIGTSFQGRNLKTIHIGDQTKPLVFYFCTIHAREWLTPMYCMYMAETLVANGGHPLLDTFSFAILPVTNPDGYVYTFSTDNLWRKTRKPNSGSSCVGTDGNRNYPVSHCGSGASTNKCSETYCGVTPFDQPETAAIRDFALANAGRIIAMNDVHSYSSLWMCPWAYTTATPPAADLNKMQTCNAAAVAGIKAINGNTWQYGPVSTTIYLAAGGAVDWFYDELGVIYAYTAELRGSSFQPAASNIIPSNVEVFNGMFASLQCIAQLELGATPSPVPAPTTPYPTAYPSAGSIDCVDLNPNGITYSDGSPAPCSEIGGYCTVYDFVAERCPATCGTCALVESAKGFTETKVIKGTFSASLVYVVAPVGSALVAGLIAGLVVLRRRKQEEADSRPPVAAASAKAAMTVAAPQAAVEKSPVQGAPKDMYDV